jgi:malyl-CoA/(S)-citramalyl-CoA lyase
VTDLVLKAGHQLDVIMLPKVEGPWDIHYADQFVAQLEAKAGLSRPILFHAILETAEGVARVERSPSPPPACRASRSAPPTSPPAAR